MADALPGSMSSAMSGEYPWGRGWDGGQALQRLLQGLNVQNTQGIKVFKSHPVKPPHRPMKKLRHGAGKELAYHVRDWARSRTPFSGHSLVLCPPCNSSRSLSPSPWLPYSLTPSAKYQLDMQWDRSEEFTLPPSGGWDFFGLPPSTKGFFV